MRSESNLTFQAKSCEVDVEWRCDLLLLRVFAVFEMLQSSFGG